MAPMAAVDPKMHINPWHEVNSSKAEQSYNKQLGLALTLLAVGVICVVGASVGLAYTSGVDRGLTALFSLVLIGGVGVALSPIRKDWTPYHEQSFYDRLTTMFWQRYDVSVDAPETEAFGAFLSEFTPRKVSKLFEYGYFSDMIQDFVEGVREGFLSMRDVHLGDEPKLAAMIRWNQAVATN